MGRATVEQLFAEAEAHSLKGRGHERRDQDKHHGKHVQTMVGSKMSRFYVTFRTPVLASYPDYP